MRAALAVAVVLSLSGCKKSHEEAVAATKAACGELLAVSSPAASCDLIGDLTMDVAKPFQDVSNEKELAPADDEYITKCMDQIAEHHDRCKDNRAYKRAMERLMFAVVQ
jgi:hypothetical protein